MMKLITDVLITVICTAVVVFLVSSCSRAQQIDEATKAWALKRAYQLNGDSMVGCRMRANTEWSCHSIDLSGEILNAQSGPKPEPTPPPAPKNGKNP